MGANGSTGGPSFIPVRIVGSDKVGNETFVGDFPGGIGFKGPYMVDLRDGATIAFLTAYKKKGPARETAYFWEVPKLNGKKFPYVFAQTMPQDAPVTMTLEGKRRRIF